MAKCVRCSRSGMGVLHQALRLKDKNYICFKCYKELGGSPMKDVTTAALSYTYDDIKDGFEALSARRMSELIARTNSADAEKFGINLKLVSQLNEAGATDPEARLLGAICSVLADEDRDVDMLDVALGHNGSLLVMIDETVAIEYKSDSGVKWIRFNNESEDKIRILGPASINKMANRVVAAYDAVIA